MSYFIVWALKQCLCLIFWVCVRVHTEQMGGGQDQGCRSGKIVQFKCSTFSTLRIGHLPAISHIATKLHEKIQQSWTIPEFSPQWPGAAWFCFNNRSPVFVQLFPPWLTRCARQTVALMSLQALAVVLWFLFWKSPLNGASLMVCESGVRFLSATLSSFYPPPPSRLHPQPFSFQSESRAAWQAYSSELKHCTAAWATYHKFLFFIPQPWLG